MKKDEKKERFQEFLDTQPPSALTRFSFIFFFFFNCLRSFSYSFWSTERGHHETWSHMYKYIKTFFVFKYNKHNNKNLKRKRRKINNKKKEPISPQQLVVVATGEWPKHEISSNYSTSHQNIFWILYRQEWVYTVRNHRHYRSVCNGCSSFLVSLLEDVEHHHRGCRAPKRLAFICYLLEIYAAQAGKTPLWSPCSTAHIISRSLAFSDFLSFLSFFKLFLFSKVFSSTMAQERCSAQSRQQQRRFCFSCLSFYDLANRSTSLVLVFIRTGSWSAEFRL